MTAPLLSATGVRVTYGGRRRFLGPADGGARAVDGVDIAVAAGEIVALVGESGCGKTTLARSLCGLQPIDAGIIEVQGETIVRHGRASRDFHRIVQFVFQDPMAALSPRMNVYNIVAEGLRIHGLARPNSGEEQGRVEDALYAVGLRPVDRFVHRYAHELSGGQRQRVVIAGAMVLEPRLLIADEPVSALDASVRGEILALLQDLVRATGVGMLVVTHDLGLAWNIADRVQVMYLGRIVEAGLAEDVLRHPAHPYSRALLTVVPETERLDQQILIGEPPDPRHIPSGCRFHPRCPIVASSRADELGIAERCRGIDPPAVTLGTTTVYCHAATSAAEPVTDPDAR